MSRTAILCCLAMVPFVFVCFVLGTKTERREENLYVHTLF